MTLARSLFLRASRSHWLANNVMRRPFARRAVKKFMPGEELSDALAAAQGLAAEGLGTVLTKLGENIGSPADAEEVRDHYLDGFNQIRARGLPSVISVKPTQLGLDLSIQSCAAHLEALAAKAESVDSTLWIDMEDSSYVDRTLDLYRDVKSRHAKVGLAIQAYLRRTPKDIESLLPLRPIIRLVKGAYAEPAHVAFPDKADTDLAYYQLADTLLHAAARNECLPIFGTHDMRLVARITGRATELGVADGGYEVHMLYGVRMSEQRLLARAGRKVATLISYGSAWWPWYMRRLAERPANVWFMVKSLVS
ncbi:MAG TPA: proline dehydrogenase family protein [Gemmatimonadales bacterium]|nr:proline dehydrogenase family protein [Gemmatimonadales bacterium]